MRRLLKDLLLWIKKQKFPNLKNYPKSLYSVLRIPYPENSIATIIIIININFLFISETNITTTRSRKKDSKNKYIFLQKGMKWTFV